MEAPSFNAQGTVVPSNTPVDSNESLYVQMNIHNSSEHCRLLFLARGLARKSKRHVPPFVLI